MVLYRFFFCCFPFVHFLTFFVLSSFCLLIYLFLEDNSLVSTIPSEIAQMPELLSLNLRDNELNTTFTSELTQMTNLQYLDFGKQNSFLLLSITHCIS